MLKIRKERRAKTIEKKTNDSLLNKQRQIVYTKKKLLRTKK